jgi:hypothetical protein
MNKELKNKYLNALSQYIADNIKIIYFKQTDFNYTFQTIYNIATDTVILSDSDMQELFILTKKHLNQNYKLDIINTNLNNKLIIEKYYE